MKKNNPWERAEVDEARLKNNRFIHSEKKAPDGSNTDDNSHNVISAYELIEAKTYGLGVQALRAAASSPHPHIIQKGVDCEGDIARPLTFKENIEAKVIDYEALTNPDGSKRSGEDRMGLLMESLDSCMGVAYKALGSPKFKIIPACRELILIDKDFRDKLLIVDYDGLQGFELDESGGKYNQCLTRHEVLNHPAWIAAVEEDRALLKAYRDIVFSIQEYTDVAIIPEGLKVTEKLPAYLMGFYMRELPSELKGIVKNELRPLRLKSIVGYVYAGASTDYEFYNRSRFMRKIQDKNFEENKRCTTDAKKNNKNNTEVLRKLCFR